MGSVLRFGVAGLNRGKLFVQAINRIPDCRVVAVCDQNPKALPAGEGVAGHTDYDKFIREPGLDVVAIVTPGPLHFQQASLALERGLHVLCETPCVYSVDEARRIVEIVQRTGVRYMLCEDYIWMGWVERLREWIDAGR